MAEKLTAAHPEQPSPHRGYSYVCQEKVSSISGFSDKFHGSIDMKDYKVRIGLCADKHSAGEADSQ